MFKNKILWCLSKFINIGFNIIIETTDNQPKERFKQAIEIEK